MMDGGDDRRDAILGAIGDAAERLLIASDWRAGVDAALGNLGRATRVSRVYLFERHADRDGTLLASQVAEWVAPGVEPQISNPDLQDVPWETAGMGRWRQILERGLTVAGLVTGFPPSERELLQAQGILSLAVVPVFAGNTWWGFLGFDDTEEGHDWSRVEVDALRAAAGLVGAAIVRRQLDEERARLVAAVEQLSDGVAVLDLSGAVLYANSVWQSAFGGAFGRPIDEILGADDPVVQLGVPTAVRGEVWRERVERPASDGSLLTLEVSTTPVWDERGRVGHVVVVQQDKSESVQMEEGLRRAAPPEVGAAGERHKVFDAMMPPCAPP